MSKSDANEKIEQEIAKDPENTLCERAWWIFYGWSIKCMRTEYRGLSCGSGTHFVEWSKEKYMYRDKLEEELKAEE